MQSRTKRHLTPAALDALPRGSAGVGCRLEHELTDGWSNSAYRVLLDDGRPAVVKPAPPPDAPVLHYERGILGTETMVYRRLADLPEGSVPAPELLDADEEFIVLWDARRRRHPPPGPGVTADPGPARCRTDATYQPAVEAGPSVDARCLDGVLAAGHSDARCGTGGVRSVITRAPSGENC
ncbi:phosphotransferase [Streptomyces sp. NPDC003943]